MVGIAPARRPRGWLAALALAGAAMPALLSLGQGLGFWDDEWDYVTTLHTQGFSLFRPYDGHWYAVPNAIWWVLLSTAGLRSYVPYLVVLLAMHIATCLVLFALLRRRAGSGAALVSMAVLLFSGYGSAVIFWALMITYLGSALCGLLALLLLDGPATDWRRAVAAGVLLLAATASSGMGLGFVAAAAVELALDPDRRRYLAALLLPAAGFAAWFALFDVHSPVQSLGSLWQTAGGYAGFALVAVLAGSAAIFGMPAVAGPMAVGLIAAALALTRRVDARTLAAAAGLLIQFTLVAMMRAASGIDSATESRYVYVATIYVLLLVTPAAARIFAARWPWRAAPIALAVFSVAINFCGLAVYTQIHRDTIAYQSAELETVDAFRGAPDLQPNASIDDQLPTVSTYFALTASLGSPVAPVSQANVDQLPGASVDSVLSRVLAIRESPATAPPASAACARAAGLADLSDPSGSWLDIDATPGTRVQLFPWLLQGPQQQPSAIFTTPASGWEAIELPRTAQPVTWHLRIQSSGPVQAWRCGQGGTNVPPNT